MDKNDSRVKTVSESSEIAQELRLCPAIGFSRLVGGKYKLRILWALGKGVHRYGEIRKSLLRGTLGQSVTPRVLSRELKELQERGLINRSQFNEVPPRVEYSLTEDGASLQPILNAIVEWGMSGVPEALLLKEPPVEAGKLSKRKRPRE